MHKWKKREIKALIHGEGAKKNILYFILFCGSCLYWAHINSSGPFMHFNSVALSRRSTYFICNPLYLEPEILACQGKWQERRREGRKEEREKGESEEKKKHTHTRAQCEFPRTSENCSAAQKSEVISSSTACDGPCRASLCVSARVSMCKYACVFCASYQASDTPLVRSVQAGSARHITWPFPSPCPASYIYYNHF